MLPAASSRDKWMDLEKKSGSDDSVPTECLRHSSTSRNVANAKPWLVLDLIAGLIAHQAADKPLLSTRLTKKINDKNTLAFSRLASPTQTASLVKIEATLPPGDGLPACGLAGAVCGPAGALCGGRVCGPWWPRLFSHVRANFDSSTPDTVTLSGSHNCRPISHHRQSWSFVLFASASSRPSRPFPARAASIGSRPTLAHPRAPVTDSAARGHLEPQSWVRPCPAESPPLDSVLTIPPCSAQEEATAADHVPGGLSD